MPQKQAEGLVIKKYGGFYYVQDKTSLIYACKIRGKIKQNILSGDRVIFTPLDTDQGILESVLPRRNQLDRPRVANVTRVLVVMAYSQPKPDLMLLDRLLFLAEFNNISACITLNKSDLETHFRTSQILDYYPQHYPVISASARTKLGLEELNKAIQGEITVLAGPSGVGKSRLLQQLTGNENIRIGEMSRKAQRGKHTTRHVELFPLSQGGWLVDTPGFSILDMPALKREELTRYFPDFAQPSQECKFSNCLHHRENECGVKIAAAENLILPSRYNNYIAMLEEVMEKEKCY